MLSTPLRIINCAEIADIHWRFLQEQLPDLDADWVFFSANRRSALEKTIAKPNLARIRACFSAAWAAKRHPNALIISHLPRATLWTAFFCKLLNCNARHLAFSFNFTSLPGGFNKFLMKKLFKSIDRFVVYSRNEIDTYAAYFQIDRARIDFLRWEMDLPASVETPGLPEKYVCSVGGEGRDYQTLMEAARQAPDINFVVVTRHYNIPPSPLPPNVIVLVDVAVENFWSIVKKCRFVVIPLRDEKTNCGHITLVGSLMLGRPIVATRSDGIADYVDDDRNALLVEPQNAVALRQAIEKLWRDEDHYQRLSHAISTMNQEESLTTWPGYLRNYVTGPRSAEATLAGVTDGRRPVH